jgi:hypothetical protein
MDLVVVFLVLCAIAWLRKLVLRLPPVVVAGSWPSHLTCG